MLMHKLLYTLSFFLFISTVNAQNRPAIAEDAQMERKIDALVSKMTLQEKIGQMTEMVLDVALNNEPGDSPSINSGKLDTLIGIYKIGSFLNVPHSHPQTPQSWQKYMEALQKESLNKLGIPCLFGLDQNHGTTYTLGGTLFPQNINMAATFNRELAREGAAVCAYETRAGSIPWVFSPVVDLSRTPLWPRMWENYGEDAYLTAEMGKNAVLGFQGSDPNHIGQQNVGSCLKHYLGYGSPVSGKDRTPSVIAPNELREKHFFPFLQACRSGALAVMVNSGSVNFVPVHANKELLTGWLKEGLDWDGVLITDWGDINNLYKREKVAADKKEAIAMAINAGIDLVMEPYDLNFCTLLAELVKEGKVPMSRIDDAVRRVLRLKFRLGLFEHPTQKVADYPKFGGAEFEQKALLAAEESMVLLKNEGNILPLQKGRHYLVTGPNANTMRSLNGAWSYSWQGDQTDRYATKYATIVKALQQKFGSSNVEYVPTIEYQGLQYDNVEVKPFEPAVEKAKAADAVIVCIGENSYCETPGNLSDLTLMQCQLDLVKALAETDKPIVLVLNEGRPRIIRSIEPLAQGIVQTFLPGNMGGVALAELLNGDANFSGKLPYTYPAYVNSLSTYDYRQSEEVGTMAGAYNYNAKINFQWPFGFGLSYTQFEYSHLKVDKTDFTATDTLNFSVEVKNCGQKAGKESVLLFSTDVVASVVPECRRLRNFTKVELKPGETKTVCLKIKGTDLAFVNYDNLWTLEPGDFIITVGNQQLTVQCTEGKTWK